jgi:biopolymer transport protein ExbD
MTWTLRHEGSPAVIEGLSTEQVALGLSEGSWETTDEVRGVAETQWLALENHPQFAELAAELEPVHQKKEPDETHLDMNPLIDVCLVLLIFFMLTASYAALQKYIESPTLNPNSITDVPKISPEKLNDIAIPVTARKEGDKSVIRVDKDVVELDNLGATLKKMLKSNTKKTSVWLDIDNKVPYGIYIKIAEEASDAGLPVLLQVPPLAAEKGKARP